MKKEKGKIVYSDDQSVLIFTMIPKLLISLFSVGLLLVSGVKNGADDVKLDITGIVNPDPKATGIVTAENNVGDQFFEGDILGVERKEDGSTRGAATADEDKLWPQGKVPYVLDSSAQDPKIKKLVEDAIGDYTKYTCIRWVPRSSEVDYVNIKTNEDGCWAWLGVIGGKQDLNVDRNGCWWKGTVVHEMMHAIGFDHEQKRTDRDRYVRINYDNIPKKLHYAFDKWSGSQDMGFPYDFQSVMHYNAYAFAENRNIKTITTVDPKNQNKIGQRAGFSTQDIEEIKKLYKCNGQTSGVGGVNGCRDNNSYWCQVTQGLKNQGENPRCNQHQLKYCQKSCKVCGNSGSQTGGGGSANCKDNNKEYCEVTLKLANGPNHHCKDSKLANYCKKSCRKC